MRADIHIVTPDGTALTVPLAWTCWTHGPAWYRRQGDGQIVTETSVGLRVWDGHRWARPARAARFLEWP